MSRTSEQRLISDRGWREIVGALRAAGKNGLADVVAGAGQLKLCQEPCCYDDGQAADSGSRFSILAFTDPAHMLRTSAQTDPKGGAGRWDAWLPAGAVVDSVVSLTPPVIGQNGFRLLIAWHLPKP